ncbi:hypothetical protein AB6A23_20835 [Paenibacillus tarimensis]
MKVLILRHHCTPSPLYVFTAGVERSFTGDFERYDERSADPNNEQIDIYISIKPNRHK